MNEREKIISSHKNLQLRIKSLNEEYKSNCKVLESKIIKTDNEITNYEHLLNTTTEDAKIKEITHLMLASKEEKAALQVDVHKQEEQMHFETAELQTQIENTTLQLEGLTLDTHKREANMEKLLAQSVRQGGLTSVEQVDILTESESKVQLKLMLVDNANLVADAKLLKNSIEDYKVRLADKEEIVKNLEKK